MIIEGNNEDSIKPFRAADAAAKANTGKLCNCPNSEPSKINLDISAHKSDCWIRKRLQTKGYIVDTSVEPRKFNDGYSLGVVLTH